MQTGGGVPTTGAVQHAEGEGYLPLEQYSMQTGGGVPTTARIMELQKRNTIPPLVKKLNFSQGREVWFPRNSDRP